MRNQQTENLAAAVADWIQTILPNLDRKQYAVVDAMLAGKCDLRVVVRLREGSVVLEGVDDVKQKRLELYREHVPPFRIFDDDEIAATSVQ